MLAYLVCLLIAYFMWRSPVVGVLLYAALASDRDGYAMQQLLSSGAPLYKLITRGLFIFVFILACLKIFHLLLARRLRPLEIAAFLLVTALSGWIVIGAIVKGYDGLAALSQLTYSGFPVLLVYIAFGGRGDGENKLGFFISFQIALAVCVLMLPFMSFLDGFRYKAIEEIGLAQAQGSIDSFADFGSIKKYAVARYAQFHNPNALGFYAASAIALGAGYIMYGQSKTRKWLAVVLVLGGTYCWLHSLTRGPIILVGMGLLVLVVLRLRGRMAPLKLYMGLIAGLLTFAVAYAAGLIDFLLPDSGDVSVTSRLTGYQAGFDAVVANPIFGVGPDWVWWMDYPHFLPLAIAADHGVLAGVLSGILLVGVGGVVVMRLLYLSSDSLSASCFLMYTSALGIAMTNNFAAPVLFWSIIGTSFLVVRRGYVRGEHVRPRAMDLNFGREGKDSHIDMWD